MSTEMAPTDGAPTAGSRSIRYSAALLLVVQAALLLAALPVIAMMLLGSLWEGGDTGLKHRILAWCLFAVIGNLAGVVAFCVATFAVVRRRSGRRAAAACAVLLTVLSSGWAWVFQGYLVSELSILGQWALLTLPGLLGSVIAMAAAREP